MTVGLSESVIEISAIVGSVTGIVGTLLAVYSIYKTHQLKNNELELEYGKLQNTASQKISELQEISRQANISKLSILVAKGKFNSGEKQKWDIENLKRQELIEKFPIEINRTDNLKKLQKKIIELDKLLKSIEEVRVFYSRSIEEDKTIAAEIKAQPSNFLGSQFPTRTL